MQTWQVLAKSGKNCLSQTPEPDQGSRHCLNVCGKVDSETLSVLSCTWALFYPLNCSAFSQAKWYGWDIFNKHWNHVHIILSDPNLWVHSSAAARQEQNCHLTFFCHHRTIPKKIFSDISLLSVLIYSLRFLLSLYLWHLLSEISALSIPVTVERPLVPCALSLPQIKPPQWAAAISCLETVWICRYVSWTARLKLWLFSAAIWRNQAAGWDIQRRLTDRL